MSSYDRPATRALYAMMLQKTEPSPWLPESDEEAAGTNVVRTPPVTPTNPPTVLPRERRAGAAPGGAQAERADSAGARPDSGTRLARARVVRIDFDGLQH